MPYRAALIGCGNMGSRYDDHRVADPPYSHAGALTLHPDFELIAIADPNEKNLSDCGQRWGIDNCYTSHDALFASHQPDIAIIATPSQIRLAPITVAIRAGVKAIICEKPLALTLEEATKIQTLIKDIPCVMNFSRRWDSGAQQVPQILQSMGALQSARGVYVNGIANNATHLIDLLHWWVGEIQQINYIDSVYPTSPTVYFKFEQGGVGSLQAHRGFDIFGLELLYEAGLLRLEDGGSIIRYRLTKQVSQLARMPILGDWQSIPSGLNHTLMKMLDNTAQVLRQNTQPLCDITDGVRVTQFLQHIQDMTR